MGILNEIRLFLTYRRRLREKDAQIKKAYNEVRGEMLARLVVDTENETSAAHMNEILFRRQREAYSALEDSIRVVHEPDKRLYYIITPEGYEAMRALLRPEISLKFGKAGY